MANRPVERQRCVACKQYCWPYQLEHGVCDPCRDVQTEARIQAQVDAGRPKLLRDIALAERWERFLRRWLAARGREGEGADPYTRPRDLPAFKRETAPVPLTFSGDD